MIDEVQNAIIEVLRDGLRDLLPRKAVQYGEPDAKNATSVTVRVGEFATEDQGIGGSASVQLERIEEVVATDGRKDYPLARPPIKLPLVVESPRGTELAAGVDYSVDFETGILTFHAPFDAPGRQIIVNYGIKRAVGETRVLDFILHYILEVRADTTKKRDGIALEIVKILFRERNNLARKGVGEIAFLKGLPADDPERDDHPLALEYRVVVPLTIEIPLPAIERIEIGQKE